jgi:hypothetical protein
LNQEVDVRVTKNDGIRGTALIALVGWFGLLPTICATASPPGFVKSTIALDAPPVGLAFDADGVLYALEGAPSGSNVATLRAILPDGSLGDSFPVVGDDPENFFVGSMAYDPAGDRLLISDNTGDGRLYGVSKTGVRQRLAAGIAGIAGVAVRGTGEIFVSTSPFGAAGEVLQVDRADGSASSVLGGLGFGAGLDFSEGALIVQDADDATFRGRLQQLPITDGPAGLEFGAPQALIDDMQAAAGLVIDSQGQFYTTGSGGLFRIAGSPLVETPFDDNGNPFQFATAIAFEAGSLPFERFSGPDGGRLAYLADFGFASQDSFVTLLTPAQPGDYNLDGSVDEADYTAWRSTFGSTIELAADANDDQVVNAADYVVWRKNQSAENASLAAIAAHGVPEPTTIGPMMMALGTIAIIFRRKRARARPARLVRSPARSIS